VAAVGGVASGSPGAVAMLRTIRVLVADDHSLMRGGVVAVLNDAPGGCVIGEAAGGVEAVALSAEHRPDVALIDLKMPGLDGVGAVEQIRATYADARIVSLTTYDVDDDVERALRAGASWRQGRATRSPRRSASPRER